MSTVEGTILCGKCKVGITKPDGEIKNDSICRCPKCGQEDRYDSIIEKVQAYFTDYTKTAMDKKLDAIASSSKFMKVTKHFDPPKREYRFISDNLPTL